MHSGGNIFCHDNGQQPFSTKFHKLPGVISSYVHSEGTKEAVLNIRPFQERNEIETRFGQVQELNQISQQGNPLKLSPSSDISHFIKRTRPEGAVLEAVELSAFVPVLSIASDISVPDYGRPGASLFKGPGRNPYRSYGYPEAAQKIN